MSQLFERFPPKLLGHGVADAVHFNVSMDTHLREVLFVAVGCPQLIRTTYQST